MATASLSKEEVKSIEEGLECSPSKSQPTSALYSGSSHNPQSNSKTGKHQAAPSGTMTNTGSNFGVGRHSAAGSAKPAKNSKTPKLV